MQKLKSSAKLYELKKIQTDFPNVKIASSDAGYRFIRQFYLDDIEIFESFFILLLNRINNTIGYAKISQGGITGTVADIRLIAKYAIENLACGVVLAHNHPSGNNKPSQQDIDLTKKVKEALKLLDVQVIDHIILTDKEYYSFADEGIL